MINDLDNRQTALVRDSKQNMDEIIQQMNAQKGDQEMRLKTLHEELNKEITELQPAGGQDGKSIDAIAAASQRATKKIEKNIDNLKRKLLPAALKTLEDTLDQKMQTQIAMSSAQLEKKLKSISS